MSRLCLRAYACLAFPWICVKRYILWRFLGRPWRTRVDDHLVVGGLILPGDVEALSREGVRAVVSMCAEFDDPVERLRAAGIDHLVLPTPDMTPPSVADLSRAIAFVSDHVSRAETTYVHCASGVGRSASVAACWLVTKGMTPEEALAHLSRLRPGTALTPSQFKVVRAFARNDTA